MNEYSQRRPSLGRIYRQSTADVLHRPVETIDVDLLANAAGGVLSSEDREHAISVIAGSPIGADLFRLLQALHPASTELAHDLEAQSLTPGNVVPFKRAQPAQLAPVYRKRAVVTRWASFAVAAAVMAAVLVSVPRSFMQGSQTSVVAQQQIAVPPVGDEIFRAEIGSRVASNRGEPNSTTRQSDTIFNSNSVGVGDKIFSARFNGS